MAAGKIKHIPHNPTKHKLESACTRYSYSITLDTRYQLDLGNTN